MLLQIWAQSFASSFENIWGGFAAFVPYLLIAIIIFIIGWVAGSLIGKVVSQLIDALKIDKLFKGTGTNEILEKSGVRISVGGFIGWIVKWFVIVVFLMTSLEFLGLTQVNDFLRETVIYYLPKVLIAALVLIIATLIADTLKSLVTVSARATNISSAKMLGAIAKYAIWAFAFIIALSELGIASDFMQILFTGLVAMLALAGGLAFGLGGKESAARALDTISHEVSK